jgi:Cof subfamily protein (haloacid dehalogenase superfamily)
MTVSRIELVVSDLDGTLITSNHELTKAAKAAAVDLYYSGVRLCLVSLRAPKSIRPFVRELGLRTPFAAFNGALIQLPDGQTLDGSTIPPTITQRIKVIAGKYGLDVWLYDEQFWFAHLHTPFVEREALSAGFKPHFDDYPNELKKPKHKLTVVGSPEIVTQVEERIRGEMGQHLTILRSKPRLLDLTAKGWDKGTLIQRLTEMLDVKAERTAVIGDGPDDIEMFTKVEVSIAMGQAVEKVRLYAAHLTASNDDDGWAQAMTNFVLLRNGTGEGIGKGTN